MLFKCNNNSLSNDVVNNLITELICVALVYLVRLALESVMCNLFNLNEMKNKLF